eukprot:gb/GECG01008393.1/.p1 GENE.gb/GECG01008393.1/~~gb/GECG01008393.1/.p1  ORF type:complete len:103 (+),score=5.02 gb/GECG01008393.1/:1-309(+)
MVPLSPQHMPACFLETGGAHRRSPVGGAANGMPLNDETSVVELNTPLTCPHSVSAMTLSPPWEGNCTVEGIERANTSATSAQRSTISVIHLRPYAGSIVPVV